MPADNQLPAFLQSAQSSAIPHDTLIGLLIAQGWTEREIYAALAHHYRAQGLDIPTRPHAGTSAKDAFFYLVLFATLATWTIALASLAFTLIDRWLPDPLFPNYADSLDSYQLTFSLAAVIVAFPLFLLVSRAIAVETTAHPEKLQSPIRKWLTYLALVAAVCVFMGDLITALAYLLRGEITSRFLLKVLIVLLLSGGVILHYFTSLRRPPDSNPQPHPDRPIALAATSAVLLTVLLAFFNLGTPRLQRDYRADTQRTQRLNITEFAIRNFYNTHQHQLPTSLDDLPNHQATDPLTNIPFDYTPQPSSSRYDLCATFAQPTPKTPNPSSSTQTQWTHPAGRHCFTLDATHLAPFTYPTYR